MRRTPIALLTAFLLCSTTYLVAQKSAEAKPDLDKQPTLYVVGYAHLDTEWRWEYPQVINEYLPNTMDRNFALFQKYPHYIFNFSGANRYRLMKEYYPQDFARVKQYVAEGRWFPAGSSMEEGDVNAPSAESIIRQILYGNDWFRNEFGKASMEYMLPDCFGFPASLPTILAHSGVKGFSTQKLTWGSSAPGGGTDSRERTPEGTPFNVGVWAGPDGERVLAALNPGSYSGGIYTDLSKPLPPASPDPLLTSVQTQIRDLRDKLEKEDASGNKLAPEEIQKYWQLRTELEGLMHAHQDQDLDRFQDDWAARVQNNGKVTGVFTDYHYYGTGDIGGAPDEDSVKRLEAIVTHGETGLPPVGYVRFPDEAHENWPQVRVGDGPVRVISATADQMFLNLAPKEQEHLPEYTGEMELTNHSAGSLTSQAYQKRWLRKEELLADAAEKSSVAASWLGGREYPLNRLNDAWTLVMGGQFHDLAAGTATPKAYEFAWNDDVIAMNQFAGVERSATEAVAAGLDTETKGIPIVVYNPLNIERQDMVTAAVKFPGAAPSSVSVTDSNGQPVPAQVSDGKVIFAARAPSVGYAVYSAQPGNAAAAPASDLHVSEHELENRYYRVQIDSDGDISSIFDKRVGRELLAGPMRLAISYDNPEQWPAWNMDWDQEQAQPKGYVSGPATVRVVENGPARVAVQISRDTDGSKFVQTVRLSAGDAGKRVEVANAIDWKTRESNLKVVFPLTAHNEMATYNMGIGTIQRPNAQPRKFEVLSHQWIDLTDAGGAYGATILTDCKNGSDKPNDNTIRLTLIRTPGTQGGYPDQGTQDIGHHEFIFGIAGHAGDWRDGLTDWEGQRLNDPLVAFQTEKHTGSLGRTFSLVKVSNPRIRIMAVKKAEKSDEIVLRMVELDGKPQRDVRVSFQGGIRSAREVNGQEQPVGPADVKGGVLETSFTAYQPRTFALTLEPARTHVAPVRSQPVKLSYDIAAASNDGSKVEGGFDGKGNALPAEMLPQTVEFHGVQFHLAPAAGQPDAAVANGQTISLPQGKFNRVYLLAAAADGDQHAVVRVGDHDTTLNIEDWGGFIGQWDDRQWQSKDVTHPARPGRPAETENDPYAVMTGIRPGYVKPAQLAWFSSHHHDSSGKNVPYAYSYLFAYSIDLPAGAQSITLPKNDKVRIFAISVAEEGQAAVPVQPLFDTLDRSQPGPAQQP